MAPGAPQCIALIKIMSPLLVPDGGGAVDDGLEEQTQLAGVAVQPQGTWLLVLARISTFSGQAVTPDHRAAATACPETAGPVSVL